MKQDPNQGDFPPRALLKGAGASGAAAGRAITGFPAVIVAGSERCAISAPP